MKYRHGLVFFIVTVVFLLSRYVIFNGFNGSDDLHYAMLAVKFLKGTYNPFEPTDIFSGRILLISLQALIYKLGGISVITTAAGTILAVIVSCQLTIFRLLPHKNVLSITLAASLFYFSPVLTKSTIGILPDAYIMLAGTIILVLLKKDFDRADKGDARATLNPLIIGFIIAISLLIKETALVFLPTVVILAFILKLKSPGLYVFKLLASFGIMALLFGLTYYIAAGDPFIKLVQIRNSSYPNPCNFGLPPALYLIVRLTYGVWQKFIVHGFYIVVFGLGVVLTGMLPGSVNRSEVNKPPGNIPDVNIKIFKPGTFESTSFIWILIASLFFPFSLDGYKPLCADSRHFLFFIPFAVPLVVNFLSSSQTKRSHTYMTVFVLLVVCACVVSTQNKWQWMIYLMFFISFCLRFAGWPRFDKIAIAAISLIAFASLFQSLFFRHSAWFNDMQVLKMRISGEGQIGTLKKGGSLAGKDSASLTIQPTVFYFVDHDNMMHWKLLNDFEETKTLYFNIQAQPFKVFKTYYQLLDSTSFNPGWIIINKTYPGTPVGLLENFNSPEGLKLLPTIVHSGEIDAYFISSQGQLKYVQSLMVQQD